MKRRTRNPRGEGTVYERADRPGTWVAEITIAGKRTRQHLPSEKLAKAALARLRQGASPFSGRASLGAWLARWVETVPRSGVEAKTAQYYGSIVRNQWLTHPLSRSPIGEIGWQDVGSALDDLRASGLSRTTVGHARAVLSAAYTAAIKARVVTANPVLLAKVPGHSTTPRVRQFRMSQAVYKQISDVVLKHDSRPPSEDGRPRTLRAYIELIARTGLRPGEALALKWGDVPIKDQIIYVRRALKQVGSNWTVGPPKTALSSRDVPFTAELMPILFQLRHRQHDPGPEAWVFPSPFDPAKPDNPVRLAKIVRKLFDAAGLTGWTPRDLRALHATLLLSEGHEMTVVSRRLGHSEAVTTYRYYAGVVTAADRRAGDGTMWDSPRVPKPKPTTPDDGIGESAEPDPRAS